MNQYIETEIHINSKNETTMDRKRATWLVKYPARKKQIQLFFEKCCETISAIEDFAFERCKDMLVIDFKVRADT